MSVHLGGRKTKLMDDDRAALSGVLGGRLGH